MIADRRKDQQKNARKGAKKASTTDRSIATGRAKRDAATKARRGLSEQTKPSAMEVDREVYRQSRKTAVAKKMAEKKASGGRLPPNSSLRDTKAKHKGTAAGKKTHPPPTGAAASVVGGKTPSKKQVEAAIIAMTDIGQPVPAGHQLVLTFVPVVTTAIPQSQPQQNHGKKGRGGGVASAGTGAGTGAGGGPKTQNRSNFRRNRGYKN
jgi:hypothetical protein